MKFAMTERTTIAVAIGGGGLFECGDGRIHARLAENSIRPAHNLNRWSEREKRSIAGRAPTGMGQNRRNAGPAPARSAADPHPPTPENAISPGESLPGLEINLC
jgi:hypothetical protein